MFQLHIIQAIIRVYLWIKHPADMEGRPVVGWLSNCPFIYRRPTQRPCLAAIIINGATVNDILAKQQSASGARVHSSSCPPQGYYYADKDHHGGALENRVKDINSVYGCEAGIINSGTVLFCNSISIKKRESVHFQPPPSHAPSPVV